MKFRDLIAALLLSATAMPVALAGGVDNYPERPVKVVVGFSAGGPTDIAARIISKQLGEELGESFVVENRPGASGAIAVQYAINQKPDGYTILMGNSGNMSVLPYLDENLSYDPQTQLDPIGLAVNLPSVFAVPTDSPFETLNDLIDYAKENPGDLSYASQGVGSLVHIGTEWFKLLTDTDIVHIPYKGDAPSIADLVAGRVDMTFFSILSALPLYEKGSIRILGVATAEELEELPGVPTIISQGVEGFVLEPWNAFLVPKGTDPEITAKLNAALNRTLENEEVLADLKSIGLYRMGGTPEDLSDYIKEQSDLWKQTIDKANIVLE